MKIVFEWVKYTKSGKTHYVLAYKGDIPKTAAEAKKITVAKWEAICEKFIECSDDDTHFSIKGGGMQSCGFCIWGWHASPPFQTICFACPIRKRTGLDGCLSTPYDKWMKRRTLANAKKELEFVKKVKV
jgi:hypothetical protein